MQLMYGTRNQAKLHAMNAVLSSLGIEMLSLNDTNLQMSPVIESGNNPLENARVKALAYYAAWKKPIFSCDSGLYIDGLAPSDQPGVHVRRVHGKELTDEEMIQYYSGLARHAGGEVRARYRNAICLVMDDGTMFDYDGDEIASEEFILTSKPHQKRNQGFPLDSLSKHLQTGKYYMDLTYDIANEDHIFMGFKNFFQKSLGL